MGVAEGADGDAAAEVEEPFAADVPDVAAAAAGEGQVEAPVAGHDVALEQFAAPSRTGSARVGGNGGTISFIRSIS